jgi:two-component system, NarL family, response regulator DevR
VVTLEVLIVDDHELVRRALRQVLPQDERIKISGEAATVRHAVDEALRLRPHVVVMDLRLPDGSGIEACRRIREQAPEVQVLILTSLDDAVTRLEAERAGAAGYVLKDLDLTDLRDSILALAAPAAG